MAKKYVARVNGQIVGTRKTANRTYTHAVVLNGHDKTDHVVTWCGHQGRAFKEASRYRGYGFRADIVEAEWTNPPSWKVEVQADSTGTWAGNGLRFATKAAAEAYAKDLMFRWTSVREWRVVRVVPSSDAADPVKFGA